MRFPCSFGMISIFPSLKTPTHVYIVPRSIPMMGSGPSLRGEAKYSSHRKKTALSCYYGVADIFDHELDINFCYKLFFFKLICTLCSD